MSNLDLITDWEVELMKVQFDLSHLRELHRVPERTFRRFTEIHFHQPPHEWLIHIRIGIAARMLPTASCCKQVAHDLFYKWYPTFSQHFVQVKGVCPKTYWLRTRLTQDPECQSDMQQLPLPLFRRLIHRCVALVQSPVFLFGLSAANAIA